MDKLPSIIFNRISQRILLLEEQPRSRGTKKLKGLTGYRIRVGEYRVLYSIDDIAKIVTILAVSHRKDAY